MKTFQSFRLLPSWVKTPFLISIIFLTSCATLSPSDNLHQRAQNYWKARLEGDPFKAWEYEENKALRRQTLQQYAKRSGPIILKAEITNVRISPENQANITIEMEYIVPGLLSTKPIKQTMPDSWIKIDNEWYHIQVPAIPREPAHH